MNTAPDYNQRREAALAQVRRTESAITGVFDARGELDAVLASLSSSSTGPDPLRAAADVDELLPRLNAAVAGVRAAAVAACDYVSKAEVAGFLDTRPALLFPRSDPARNSAGTGTSSPPASGGWSEPSLPASPAD